MYIDNDIPKIDLPEDWIIGKLTKSEIGLLNLYANYPCRLKAEIFVLCLQGDLEASIDLTRYKVRPGNFITIQPDRKSTRLNSSHIEESRMPSSA